MVLTLRNWRLALISALVLGAAPVYAQDTPASTPAQVTQAEASALNAELLYELLLGEMSAHQGDYTNAIALLLEAARNQPAQEIYQRASQVALQARSGQRALMVANAWQQSFPTSREANRYLLQILLMLNRISETQEPLTREVAATPLAAKQATYLSIAQLYSRSPDKPLAATVVEQALQPDTQQPQLAADAWATIGHMRLMANQKETALQALDKAYQADARSGAMALLALELMESGSTLAEAKLHSYMQHQPASTIQLAYARVLMGKNRAADAQKQLRQLLKQHPQHGEAWLLQASLHAQQSDWTAAQKALQQAETLLEVQVENDLTRSNALNQLYLLGGRVSLQQKEPTLALQWLNKIPQANALLEVQTLKAAALAQQGKLAQGRALIRATPATSKEQELQKRQAEVVLLRDSDAPQEAYLLQRTLMEQFPDNPDLAYETAILAERAGKLEMMENILLAIIAQHPEYHHAHNALGYSWADRNIQLPQARALIETALSYAPNDPFITDSLGWVEFRMGNGERALQLLSQAYATRDDVEIAAHLGEVLWSLGQKSRARTIWRQAHERDPNNTTLRETLKRLNIQL